MQTNRRILSLAAINKKSRELILKLRQDRSQEFIARRLKISKVQIYRWEKGISEMRMDTFCNYCINRSADISLLKINGEISAASVFDICENLLSKEAIEEYSKQTKITVTTVKRWLSKKNYPTLNQFLSLLWINAPHLYNSFIASIIKDKSEQYFLEKTLLNQYPFISGFIELARISPNNITFTTTASKVFNIEEAKVEQLKCILQKESMISIDNDIITVNKEDFHLSRNDKEFNATCEYWSKFNIKKVFQRGVNDFFSFSTFTLTEEDINHMKMLLSKVHEESRKKSRSTNSDKKLFSLTIQMNELS